MARPKGSKNRKPKNTMSLDEIYTAKSAAEEELSALNTEISELMEQVKAKRAAVQAVKRKLTSLGKKEAEAQALAAQEKRNAEAQELAAAFLNSDKSLEEVMKTSI